MLELVLFDLDGCVSDDRWRRHHRPIDRPAAPDAYDAYNSLCHLDQCANREVVISEMQKDRFITFVTARPKKWRSQTRAWLNKNFPGWHACLMRPDDNVEGSPHLKERLVLDFINRPEAIKSTVVKAYDDRDDVINMYRALGFDAQLLEIKEN